MKVLLVHVPYQVSGGENIHVQKLSEIYRSIDIDTVNFPLSNRAPESYLGRSLSSLLPTANFSELDELCALEKVDFIHVHNTLPILGPRFFRWMEASGLPSIMTIHNHRFFCTNGLALRDDKICKACFSTKNAWRGLVHNCNADWTKSTYHALALTQMRQCDLFTRGIKIFLAPSPYIFDELIRYGIPEISVRLLLHAADTTPVEQSEIDTDVLFAGRLSNEKGIQLLLECIEKMPEVKFKVVGSGPEEARVRSAQAALPNLKFEGPKEHQEVIRLIAKTRVGILPSICHEIFSLFLIESFLQGKQCVVANSHSTQWMGGSDIPCNLAAMGNATDFCRAIKEALSKEPLGGDAIARIRQRFGMERYKIELKKIVTELLH